MKKIFLAVAVLATSLAANAQTYTLAAGQLGTYSGAGVYVVETSLSATTDVSVGTFTGYPDFLIGAKHSDGTTKISWKFGADYFQPDAGDTYLVINKTIPAGKYVIVVYSAKGSTAVPASQLSAGKNTASIDSPYPTNIAVYGNEVTAPAKPNGAEAERVTAIFSVTASGTVTLKSNVGHRIYSITISDSPTAAIGDVNADGAIVVAEAFYSIAGAKLAAEPDKGFGAYIKVTTYDNGAVESAKFIK